MMQFRALDLDGLVEINPEKRADARGYFAETFREDHFRANIGTFDFVQENQSLSLAIGTIRGIHFQVDPCAQGKLVRCLAGSIFDVAVDLRPASPTYGKWLGIELSAQQCNQLWIPAGFGHAFCTLSEACIVGYRVTSYYSAAHDRGVRWDDPAIGIAWPAEADPDTLSAKDRVQPMLAQLQTADVSCA